MNLNRPVEQGACGVRCDLEGDGTITGTDARILVRLCTRPHCKDMESNDGKRDHLNRHSNDNGPISHQHDWEKESSPTNSCSGIETVWPSAIGVAQITRNLHFDLIKMILSMMPPPYAFFI